MPSSTRRRSNACAWIVALRTDHSDPRPRAECRLVARDTFVAGDQQHPHVRNVEQESVDVDPAALRDDDLCGMSWQAERRAQRDQLRMPDGEERIPMDAARSSEDGIGRYTREAFIDQMLVGCATAERAWIGPAGIAILRLDEHQRHRGLASTLDAPGRSRRRSAVESTHYRCPAHAIRRARRTASTTARSWPWPRRAPCRRRSAENRRFRSSPNSARSTGRYTGQRDPAHAP